MKKIIILILVFLIIIASVNAYLNYRDITITNPDFIYHINETIELKVQDLTLPTNDCNKELLLKDENDSSVDAEIIYDYGNLTKGQQWCQIAFKASILAGQSKIYKLYYNNATANEVKEQVYIFWEDWEDYNEGDSAAEIDAKGIWTSNGLNVGVGRNYGFSGNGLSLNEISTTGMSKFFSEETQGNISFKGKINLLVNDGEHLIELTDKAYGGFDSQWILYMPNQGISYAYANRGSPHTLIKNTLVANQWYDFTQTFDLTKGTFNYYSDNILIANDINIRNGGTLPTPLNQINVFCGGAGVLPCNLYLDNIRIYSGNSYPENDYIIVQGIEKSTIKSAGGIKAVVALLKTGFINIIEFFKSLFN